MMYISNLYMSSVDIHAQNVHSMCILRELCMRDKRRKFIDLAQSRVNRAIKDIRLIGNLANRNSYEYSEEDARRIVRALQKEVDAAKARFLGDSGGKDTEFRLEG